ncbi:hypothetical protein ANCDUO_26781, partial [Ancylostoma duodenale]
VVNILRDEELVVEHVFCLLDREQGGAEKLKEHGITLHSLLNMETVLTFLKAVDAIDDETSSKIISLVEKAAPFVVAIKVHADAITDFSTDFTAKLVRLANDHEFVIFEDRKFGDTGNTNILQLRGAQRIAEWADVVTVHAVQGSDSNGAIFRQ